MNQKIRKLLIDRAISHKPIYYGEIMKLLNLRGGVQEDHDVLSYELAEISRFEHRNNRPLLSSVATYSPETARQKKGEVHGNGFYELAEGLLGRSKSDLKKEFFAIAEMNRCKDYWSDMINFEQFAELESTPDQHSIEFFTSEEIEFLAHWGGKVYIKDNEEHVAAKNYIMNSLGSKTQYWSNKLVSLLHGFDTFNWRMWNQKGWEDTPDGKKRVAIFKKYTWARIYKLGDEHKDIFFTVGVDAEEKALVWKIEYYFSTDSYLTEKQQEIVRDNIPQNAMWNEIPIEEIQNYDWNQLLSITRSFIAENSQVYDNLISLAWGSKGPEEVFRDTLNKKDRPIVGIEELPELNPTFKGTDNDFLQEAIENKEIGDAGEALVVEYEKQRLHAIGHPELAEKVRKVKDGFGYDIYSYNNNGEPKYIEVKTTTGNEATPFFYTINEYLFAEKFSDSYQIYRLYNYSEELNKADFYVLEHPLQELLFQPTIFRSYLKQTENE